jgi:peptidoglycan/LPS O-acetylase OafA/YrhL
VVWRGVGCALAIAYASYRLIEQPLLRLRSQLLAGGAPRRISRFQDAANSGPAEISAFMGDVEGAPRAITK